ncbi:actin-binding protein WASF1-like [Cylas formicarius]|uniref:actin-binding protein WASF1-like n=1 Tax=Cylas formicarius TaxID=197179 RepID=UPI002958B25B|nr:actin-binding protein WASF1-like [Cylas formicarius]
MKYSNRVAQLRNLKQRTFDPTGTPRSEGSSGIAAADATVARKTGRSRPRFSIFFFLFPLEICVASLGAPTEPANGRFAAAVRHRPSIITSPCSAEAVNRGAAGGRSGDCRRTGTVGELNGLSPFSGCHLEPNDPHPNPSHPSLNAQMGGPELTSSPRPPPRVRDGRAGGRRGITLPRSPASLSSLLRPLRAANAPRSRVCNISPEKRPSLNVGRPQACCRPSAPVPHPTRQPQPTSPPGYPLDEPTLGGVLFDYSLEFGENSERRLLPRAVAAIVPLPAVSLLAPPHPGRLLTTPDPLPPPSPCPNPRASPATYDHRRDLHASVASPTGMDLRKRADCTERKVPAAILMSIDKDSV